jgi:hypothetical protein
LEAEQTDRIDTWEAMRPGGRVIVVEMFIGEIGEPGVVPLMDLNMM